jgi:phage N-6-adenine-methyltransferase
MWETPQEFFDKVNEQYHFDLDVCASPDNAKCDKYYSEEDDGLSQVWEGSCWMNPPYGREIEKWVKKASESKTLVVALLPARTDTKWFHDYILGKAEITFIKGRLTFSKYGRAPFPSMLVIWNSHDIRLYYDFRKI